MNEEQSLYPLNMPSTQSILMLGCFDTKGEVFSFLRQCILEQGEQVIAVNTGVMGTTTSFPVDIESDQVALEGGCTIDSLREKADRGHAVDRMGRGAARIIARLVKDGQIKGAIGMGGGGGTYIALSAMQEIPLSIPKICLSTLAAKDLSRQMGNKNIVLMPSVVDVAGLNRISRLLIQQAAKSICAMTKVNATEDVATSGTIAISMFGNTTNCVDQCSELLEKRGYEVLAFHATGVGGKTMEALIREGYFDAVLDVTTTELADELCGGVLSAGPDRLNAAAEIGVPQVVVPGCLDMVNFAQMDMVPEKYKSRKLYAWAPDVTLMRTNIDENIILGEILTNKLNQSNVAATILLPTRGISQLDTEGGFFYNPEIDQALFGSIKKNVSQTVNVIEVDAHINDRKFAEIAVKTLLNMIERK
ncbi:Tm-1-like ATP-binding domain-containing protein [Catalinimonas niigatensis]|uniref:Tm-1-like ATP-binding domain-containing protein n=1 Tax=Catalinimonas niigatensis TaxID=1397264 RepID=UPI002666B041|nr:Tm-1-like ATP-binding domain-containing protein [Catalinimonas niigatensis]WPP50941.1 Tm-1-like ATP-binding domain-containing protein [Catalinimonas niigatensis]